MRSIFFDTNILVYAVLDQDVEKKRVAASLIMDAIAERSFFISSQVLKEFTNILIRKSDKPLAAIHEDVRRFAPFVSIDDTPELILRGLDLMREHSLQFYDSLIIAAAEAAKCHVLFSEDMADGAEYGHVKIVNPFTSQLLQFGNVL